MENSTEKKEHKAPDDLVQFIFDTKNGKFDFGSTKCDMQVRRFPNYHQPSETVYLHGIR